MPYGILAIFKHNEDSEIEAYTLYNEKLFNDESEAEAYLDDEYETFAQACYIDNEVEEDLQNFYLDDIVVYDVDEFERNLHAKDN